MRQTSSNWDAHNDMRIHTGAILIWVRVSKQFEEINHLRVRLKLSCCRWMTSYKRRWSTRLLHPRNLGLQRKAKLGEIVIEWNETFWKRHALFQPQVFW